MHPEISFQDFYRLLKKIVGKDSRFIGLILLYGIVVSVATLAIPLSIQNLVNTVGFVNLLQPLIVLSFLLASILILSGFFQLLQMYMVELFTRKIFARIGSELTVITHYSQPALFRNQNRIDIINRFLDVPHFCKNVSTLAVDGFAIFLQLLVGLTLISFYHPFFLAFTILLGFLIYFVFSTRTTAGMNTSVRESASKYQFLSFLQDVTRGHWVTQKSKHRDFIFSQSDQLLHDYVARRKAHFRKFFSQYAMLILLYILATVCIIVLGGILVMKNQLSLGQLVAAEIIVTGILFNLGKSGKYLEIFYDLSANVYKINELLHSNTVDQEKSKLLDQGPALDIEFENVRYAQTNSLLNFNLKIPFRKRFYIQVKNAPCKELFVDYLLQSRSPSSGRILFNGISQDKFLPQVIKDRIYVVRDLVFLEDTIRNNLTMGDPSITDDDIKHLLEVFEMTSTIKNFDLGLETKVLHTGFPFWKNKMIRLDMIRGILSKPSLVVLTETFRVLDIDLQKRIIEFLSAEHRQWSLINFASRKDPELSIYDEYLQLDWNGFQ